MTIVTGHVDKSYRMLPKLCFHRWNGVKLKQRRAGMIETKYTISKAAASVGLGRTTLVRHIKEKSITVEKNAKGHQVIDVSELSRVYGSDFNPNRISETASNKTLRRENQEPEQDRHFQALKEQYEARIADLKDALEKADRAMLLLEDRSSQTDEWKRAISEMKTQVANEAKAEMREMREAQAKEIKQLKRLLHEERANSKSIWKKLFG